MVAIDRNPLACKLTKENAISLGLIDRLTIINASIDDNGTIESSTNEQPEINFNDERFDFIVSNPPYIPTARIMKLEPEIRV